MHSGNYDYFYSTSGNGADSAYAAYNTAYGGASGGQNQNQFPGYRSFGRGWKNLERIPEWLELAQMT